MHQSAAAWYRRSRGRRQEVHGRRHAEGPVGLTDSVTRGGSMAGESSFDVVSDFDDMEMRNALDQVRREVQQRYDFKGATYELSQTKTELVLLTDDEFRAKAVRDLIETK